MSLKNADSKTLKGVWVDPDDAPELTKEWFETAELRIGDVLIRRATDVAITPADQEACAEKRD